MTDCCDTEKSGKCICQELECKVTETEKGFRAEITTKDPAKTKSLKALVKSFRELCGCC